MRIVSILIKKTKQNNKTAGRFSALLVHYVTYFVLESKHKMLALDPKRKNKDRANDL